MFDTGQKGLTGCPCYLTTNAKGNIFGQTANKRNFMTSGLLVPTRGFCRQIFVSDKNVQDMSGEAGWVFLGGAREPIEVNGTPIIL